MGGGLTGVAADGEVNERAEAFACAHVRRAVLYDSPQLNCYPLDRPFLAFRPEYGIYYGQMRYEIVLAPQAAESLRALSAFDRSTVRDALETHLRHEPTKVSKSRIKRLRGFARPQFRLRVNDIRVFYDITEEEIQILAIVTKAEAEAWLRTHGETAP